MAQDCPDRFRWSLPPRLSISRLISRWLRLLAEKRSAREKASEEFALGPSRIAFRRDQRKNGKSPRCTRLRARNARSRARGRHREDRAHRREAKSREWACPFPICPPTVRGLRAASVVLRNGSDQACR